MPLHVALVADSPASAVTLTQLLELEGFSVAVYHQIVDLLDIAAEAGFDVVVFDQSHWSVRERAMALVLRERLLPGDARLVLVTSLVELGLNPPELIDAVVVRPYFPGDLLNAITGEPFAPPAASAYHS